MKIIPNSQTPPTRKGAILGVILITAVVAAAALFGVVALLISIYERKQEAKNPFFRVV
ncbi:MAG: hypothetical protein H3C63_11245, partial [Candidatus Omnitrophica bacterium]|nr:hypothetical protein [Candidatus Omnitrophota bacterium]